MRIDLPKICDKRGNLSFIEGGNHIPFEIKRVFWIYDVPGGEKRGGHAYKNCDEFIIALSGSFDLVLDDGTEKRTVSLNRSYNGLFVPRMVWREMYNFSTNTVVMVLASKEYCEDDYIRDYEEFERICKTLKNNEL